MTSDIYEHDCLSRPSKVVGQVTLYITLIVRKLSLFCFVQCTLLCVTGATDGWSSVSVRGRGRLS